jgi:hypothetical protein
VLTVTTVAVLGTAAGPAWGADGFSLQLSAPSTGVVGRPMMLTASGTNPTATDYPYPTYLDAELFRPSVVPTCPATQSAASGLAAGTGGALLAWDVQMDIDATGAFSIPFGLTPASPGPLLVCGYTAGLAGETLASASLTLPVQGAESAPAAATPRSLAAPRLKRSGSRVTCDTGRWSNSPTGFSFAWRVDGRTRRGAAGRTLAVTRTLRGHVVQCAVTASNGVGRSTALSQRLAIRRAA